MQGGDSAMFSTGSEAAKRAKVFCKEDSVSMLVGNDTAFVLNRAGKVATLSVPSGGQLELSQANGFLVGDSSGAGIQIKGGKITLNAGAVSLPGGLHVGGALAQPLVNATAFNIVLGTMVTALNALTPVTPYEIGLHAALLAMVASFPLTCSTVTLKGI
jgi:hypothetical protein